MAHRHSTNYVTKLGQNGQSHYGLDYGPQQDKLVIDKQAIIIMCDGMNIAQELFR